MKIAFVDLGRHYGGIEVYILSLIEAWKCRENECVILARKNSIFYQRLVDEGYEKDTIAVDFDLGSIKEARKRLLDEKVELIHMNGINSGVFTKLMHLPIKNVATVHGNAAYDRIEKSVWVQKLFVFFENCVLKSSEKIIAVSIAIRDLLTERGIDKKKIVVVHNGIDKLSYEKNTDARAEIFKICFVGRLEKVKGCEYLIKALAKIKDRDFICHIYGDGSLKEELIAMCEELGIKDKVVFKGFSNVIRDNLYQYDVLIQPSLYEALPLTPLEAMNARTLVLCSDVGGLKEVVSHGETGLRFAVGDVEELAKDILWAMEHPVEADLMREKAYKCFVEEFTREIMCEKTFGLFERVCNDV